MVNSSPWTWHETNPIKTIARSILTVLTIFGCHFTIMVLSNIVPSNETNQGLVANFIFMYFFESMLVGFVLFGGLRMLF